MLMPTITARPLTAADFAPFGQVIQTEGAHHYPINAGMTERFHDLARVELAGQAARPLISIFRGQPYSLPLTLTLMERHPLGSQAFYPLSGRPFLVTVAPDDAGRPGTPQAFLTAPDQGVNIAINTWHGVLTPLEAVSDFLVFDRGGEGINVEEFTFAEPWTVVAAA
jgi:ureidoglycolate lyase